jgi:hypothetical protein
MSYSFSARAATKPEVIAKVAAQFDAVVAAQPVHSADRAQAQAAAEAFLGVLPDAADGRDFYVSVSGSVGWNGNLGEADHVLTAAGVNVSASFLASETR